MRLKTFIADDMQDALAKVRAELGIEAVIVSSQRTKGGGVMVRAALDEAVADAEYETAVAAFAEAMESELAIAPQSFEQQFHHGLIRRLRQPAPVANDRPLRDFNRAELLTILRGQRMSAGPAHALAEAAEKSDLSDMVMALAAALDGHMTIAPIEIAKSHTLLLAGPHGAGKTAVAAKLAHLAARSDREVRLIAGDAQGAGAVERLRTFAEHLDTPFLIAATAEAMRDAVHDCAKDGILGIIDTAGFDPRNVKARNAFAALAGIEGLEALGVVSASGDAEETAEIARALHALGTKRLIVTGLDLARRMGALAAAAMAGPGLAYVTRSPFAAGALETLTPLSLARTLIEAAARESNPENES